ncbi:MAG: hypothetical protein JWN70_5139 [Planctomycetaceae bacterium]|nr:hypothetical protein [Planctomycetaceae bacterium]
MTPTDDPSGFHYFSTSADDLVVPDEPGIYVARIPQGIDRKSMLLRSLARELKFPDYFGCNFDALEDCLRDFSWLPDCRKIVIIHTGLPMRRNRVSLAAYLQILSAAVAFWKTDPQLRFDVYFPKPVSSEIARHLAE